MEKFTEILANIKKSFTSPDYELAAELASLKTTLLTQEEISKYARKQKNISLSLIILLFICTLGFAGCFCVCAIKEDFLFAFLLCFTPLILFLSFAIALLIAFMKSDDKKFAFENLKAHYIKLLRSPKNKKIKAIDSIIEQIYSKNPNYDAEVVGILTQNKNLLHRIITPLSLLSLDFLVSPSTLNHIIQNSYLKQENYAIGDLPTYLNHAINEEKIQLILDCNRQNFTYKPIEDDLGFHNQIFLLDNCDKELFKNLLNRHFASIPETQLYYLHSQLGIVFTKLFVYLKETSNIIANEELLTILTNAYRENSDILEIAYSTREIFLEYASLSDYDLPFVTYVELLRVFFIIIIECRGFYNSEELVLDFDPKSLTIENITEKIIEQKLFRKYDSKKLLLSIAYAKNENSSSPRDFFSNLQKIQFVSMHIQKAKHKDDLLNGIYVPQRTSITDIDLMSGTEFEEFLRNFFTGQGYKCQTTKTSGDQGIDLIAAKDDIKLAIQAKCYTGSVGNHAVMEAVAGTKYYKANRTMVITNSTFTKSAIELAKANNVTLWDRQILIEKISQH